MSERDSASPAIAGVLLAAGAGTRFGMPKILAEQGEWLAGAVGALFGGGCDDVVVVMGAAVVDVPSPARAIVASDWSRGPGASLLAGLNSVSTSSVLGADYVVILTVDTPDIDSVVVARVLQAAVTSTAGIARAYYGARPGHPVVIARELWPALKAALRAGAGARQFLSGRHDVVSVECADLATGRDIDSAADLQIER